MSGADRRDLARRLTFVVGTMNRRLRPPADGLSHVAVSALSSISRAAAVRPGDLARMEGIAAPGMTRLVAELEQRGLVARSADPHDRRSTLLSLTAEGERELREARTSRSAWVAALLDEVAPDDLAAVERAVTALEAALLVATPERPVRSTQPA
ncbi:MAG TPA: MarR family transcriptional regulator [Amnibacterium sp.]|nr:MarR family transcriptional regulator [Amnibacterium sp.]